MLTIDRSYNIELTRGDTGLFTVYLVDEDNMSYTPQAGSTLRFALSKKYGSTRSECLVVKDIPIDTMTLEIEPSDTKTLAFGDYVYDIELTDPFGRVSTVVMAKFKITKEVY